MLMRCIAGLLLTFCMRVQADGSPLMVGQPTTLTLSSTSKNFTGFFIMNPAFGVISNASSKSDLYYECGLGHTEKSIKTSVTFSFTPWMDGAVTFTGYVHTTLKPPVWYVLESTLQVGLPTTAVAYPPPAPPAPPHVRYTFTTLLSLRSVNFTKFAVRGLLRRRRRRQQLAQRMLVYPAKRLLTPLAPGRTRTTTFPTRQAVTSWRSGSSAPAVPQLNGHSSSVRLRARVC
jgi:hypothetical protein